MCYDPLRFILCFFDLLSTTPRNQSINQSPNQVEPPRGATRITMPLRRPIAAAGAVVAGAAAAAGAAAVVAVVAAGLDFRV